MEREGFFMGLAGRLTALLLLAAASGAQAGAAPPGPAMSFVVVRGGGVECDPDCPEWIAAQGEIKPGTARLFQAFLAKLDGRRRPVVINSNGGSVEDALEIGRLIRARRLAVAVGRTTIFEPPAASNLLTPSEQTFKRGYAYAYPALCLSACTFILAAGIERYASPLAIIGVHEVKQHLSRTFVLRKFLVHYRIVDGQKIEVSREVVSENKNTVTSTEIDPASVDTHLVAYFKEMGEDRKLLDLMRTATPDKIHLMTAIEAKESRLVTIWFDQSAVMMTKPPDSGLAGTPADPASGARATLEAGRTWTLDGAEDAGGRQFAVHFVLRRGGAGVAATFTLLDPAHVRLRYGVTPGVSGVRRSITQDGRTTAVFLPNDAFCRLAQVGDIYVVRAPLPHPPTHAPGLPDPRAPLLLTPFSSVGGASALVDEICAPLESREAHAARRTLAAPAARTRARLKKS